MRRSRFSFAAGVAAGAALLITASGAGAQVLRVGTFHGVPGQFSSIQAAVDAAAPGDYVLVGPGDYKEHSDRTPGSRKDLVAGVLITTGHLRLRGMDRNATVVDGTKPGAPQCSRAPSDQSFGPSDGKGGNTGENGVLVWKAPDVWVQNMTVCNFLNGNGVTGNEVWWDGGDSSGQVGGFGGFLGSYLNATSTYFGAEQTAAQYGIFSSNWSGGTWDHDYASNFNDSGYYIGACQQICDQTMKNSQSEYNALGYSGSNSGGQLVIDHNEFDHNEDGFDTNSQNGDDPSPQNGACPNNGISPITHTHSCWVFMNNYVHDNNNPNVPTAGEAAAGPVGTGMSISGGRNDTVMNNRFANNNAWGVILVPYPDSSGAPCVGGQNLPTGCEFDEWGDAIVHNTFTNNGSYGHPTNGDIAKLNLFPGEATDCYSANTDTGGTLTTSPSGLEQSHPTCDGSAANPDPNPVFLGESLCDTQVMLAPGQPVICPTGQYPRRTSTPMPPLPAGLPSMPDPCAGVPANAWCGGTVQRMPDCVRGGAVRAPLTLADGERFISVTVRVPGARARTFRAHGQRASVRIPLAGRAPWRVSFVEKIKVARHTETVRFTQIYSAC